MEEDFLSLKAAEGEPPRCQADSNSITVARWVRPTTVATLARLPCIRQANRLALVGRNS